MTDKYAVIGNPIAHSKSPLIHSEFAKQTGQAMAYEAILAPLNDFAGAVQTLITQGYKGVNVTVPFKFAAYDMADQRSERAMAAGAANTERAKVPGPAPASTTVNGAGQPSSRHQSSSARARTAPNSGPISGEVMKSPRRPA